MLSTSGYFTADIAVAPEEEIFTAPQDTQAQDNAPYLGVAQPEPTRGSTQNDSALVNALYIVIPLLPAAPGAIIAIAVVRRRNQKKEEGN